MENKTPHQCLNCGTELSSSYCPNCGQKASIHRYSIMHFIEHDFVHGVFHFDKGFFYTLKELFTRPGHSVREFIEGKRAKHFNVFTFLILIITAGHFLGAYSNVDFSQIYDDGRSKDFMTSYQKFLRENPKAMPLLLIPVYSLCSFLFFKKSKQNFSEHLVLNTFKASAEFAIGLIFSVIMIFSKDKTILIALLSLSSLSNLVYSIWFYRQYFSAFGYKKFALLFRSIFAAISPQFVTMIIGAVIGIILALLS